MGKVKIQFAISDDLKQSVSVLNNANASLLKAMSDADTAVGNVRKLSSSVSKIQSDQGKISVIAENKAKEIGVPANSIPGYNDAEKAFLAINSTLSDAKDY